MRRTIALLAAVGSVGISSIARGEGPLTLDVREAHFTVSLDVNDMAHLANAAGPLPIAPGSVKLSNQDNASVFDLSLTQNVDRLCAQSQLFLVVEHAQHFSEKRPISVTGCSAGPHAPALQPPGASPADANEFEKMFRAAVQRATALDASDVSACSSQANCYLHKQDVVVVVIDSKGEYIGGEPRDIDENDRIVLAIVDDSAAIGALEVTAGSCNAPAEFRIRSTTAGDQGGATAGEAAKPQRAVRAFSLGPCAPPGLKWRLNASAATETSTAKVEKLISTDPLYRLSVGIAYGFSFVQRSHLGVAPSPDGSGSRIIDNPADAGAQLAIPINLYLCPRNYKHSAWSEWQPTCFLTNAVSPAIALTPSNLSKSIMVGANIELLSALSIGVFAHFLDEAVLDKSSGLTVGGPTTITSASAIPTTDKWKTGVFVSANLSLSAAADLLSAIGNRLGK